MSVFVTQNTRHYFVLPFQHFHPVLLFTIHQTHKRVLAAISHIATYRMPLSTSLCRVKLTQITATKLRGTMAQVVGSDFLPLCRMLLPVFSFSFHTSPLSIDAKLVLREARHGRREKSCKKPARQAHIGTRAALNLTGSDVDRIQENKVKKKKNRHNISGTSTFHDKGH